MGFLATSSGYIMYNSKTKTLIIAREIKLDEDVIIIKGLIDLKMSLSTRWSFITEES